MGLKKRRILFITPLATRTGSEMMLWHLVRHLDRSRYEVAVASYAPGELLDQMPPDVKVYRIPGTFGSLERISYHLGRHPIKAALKKIQKEFKPDFWYLNTIVLPEAATTAVELNVPFLVHFHEMPLSYVYVNEREFDLLITKGFHHIGCSEATCEGIKQAGSDRVSLLHSFIDARLDAPDEKMLGALRRKFGIAPGDFVWIMSGTASERKGFDFFPEIARELDEARTHLVWIGGRLPDGYVSWVENRVRAGGAKTRIHLAGKQKEAYAQFFHLADGFVLTSRQDPFPLVMIEAASLGKPIVSFPSGGVSELLLPGMGLVTEDLSVRQLTEAMRRVMNGAYKHEPELSRSRAAAFSIPQGIRKWEALMDRVLTERAL